MSISTECLSYLKQNVNDFATTEISNVAKERILSTDKGKLLAKGALAAYGAYSNDFNSEANRMIGNMSSEAKSAITKLLITQMTKFQGTKKGAVLSNTLLKTKQIDGLEINTRDMVVGFVDQIGPEQLNDTSTIKDRFIRSMVNSSLIGACTGNTTVTKIGNFFSSTTTDIALADEGLAIMKESLMKTPLIEGAFQDTTFMNSITNESLDLKKSANSKLNEIIVGKGLDISFDKMTDGITNSLPANVLAIQNGGILPTTKATVTNCLVSMADVRKIEPTVDILADSKVKMEEAIISLKEEDSLVTSQTVISRMQYLNDGDMPVGLTEASTRTALTPMLSYIEGREDVLDKFPSIPNKDGYELLKKSVIQNIKSPFQMLQHTIDDATYSSEEALGSSLTTQISKSTISEDGVSDLSTDETVITNISDAQQDNAKADEIDEVLSYIPTQESTRQTYTRLTYENERSAPIT